LGRRCGRAAREPLSDAFVGAESTEFWQRSASHGRVVARADRNTSTPKGRHWRLREVQRRVNGATHGDFRETVEKSDRAYGKKVVTSARIITDFGANVDIISGIFVVSL
jgi:hypothetical protein